MLKPILIVALLAGACSPAPLAQAPEKLPMPSAPISTLTANPTPGHITEARVLGLDPHLFTRTELAQIDAEERLRDRRDRLRFILQMKDRRGELPPGFMQTEAPRIIRSIGF